MYRFKQIKIKLLRFLHKKITTTPKDRLIKSLILKSLQDYSSEVIYSPKNDTLSIIDKNNNIILLNNGTIRISDDNKNVLVYQPYYKVYNNIVDIIEEHLNNVNKYIDDNIENIENEFLKNMMENFGK